jgi:hypothetical protein
MSELKIKNDVQRFMAVDCAKPNSFFYSVREFSNAGDSQQIAHGEVKTKRWITRKAKQLNCSKVLFDGPTRAYAPFRS